MRMPPQAEEGAEGETSGGSEGGGAAQELIASTQSNLAKIVGLLNQSPDVPDDVKQMLSASLEGFRAGIQKLIAAPGGGSPMPESQGTQTMEQGGNSKSVPAY
jgi:hypothetical protein